jgi:quercetin dioxygenase-like cupin family protein
MSNFYDDWLSYWDKSVTARKHARKVIHEEEIRWVTTRQDAKVGLLVAPETGFKTWGTVSMVAEIPPGWHTGEHAHGEEAIYVVSGQGFSVVNGVRYDWANGSTLWIPFGARHQHFNAGPEPARYYSIMAVHLEYFLGLHKMDQSGEHGRSEVLPDAPRSTTGLDARGRRIVLKWEEAPRRVGSEDESTKNRPARSPVMGEEAYQVTRATHHSLFIDFMRPGAGVGFQNREVEISGILSDKPRSRGGKHAHMEAILYILEGEGHSIVDGERIPWKKGTCFHIQGPQTVHQHFNTGHTQSQMLRAASGVRMNFFQQVAQERFPYLWFEPHDDQ